MDLGLATVVHSWGVAVALAPFDTIEAKVDRLVVEAVAEVGAEAGAVGGLGLARALALVSI